MKTFYVKVQEVYYTEIKVIAKNEKDARQKAEDLLADGDCPEGQYDYTLDKDHWMVYE